jgi:hypothetical protein
VRRERAMNAHDVERIFDAAQAIDPADRRLAALGGASETLGCSIEFLDWTGETGTRGALAFFH